MAPIALLLSLAGPLLGCNKSTEQRLVECERKLLADPADAATHARRGDLLRKLDRDDEAVNAYGRALELRPDDFETRARRAEARLDAGGEPAQALADVDRAIQAGLADAQLHALRGRALEGLHRREEALEAYARAAELEPASASYDVLAGDLLRRMERHPEAVAAYRRALDRSARSPGEVYLSMGLSLWLLDRTDEALEAFERASEFGPNALRATRMRAHLLEKTGRHEEALEAYTHVCEVYPADPIAAVRRAALLEQLGRFEEALDAYDHYLARVPGSYAARTARDHLAREIASR